MMQKIWQYYRERVFTQWNGLTYVWAVRASDALEKDERAEDDDADGAEDVPRLATVEDSTQDEVVVL